MKVNPLYIIGAAVLTFMLISKKGSAATYDGIDLSSLSDYGSDDVQRLQNLANELATRGLTDLQIKMMLAQALQETGIFTDSSANYHAVDAYHNYAGISHGGTLTAYNSISDFVDDWIRILNFGPARPIDATNILDFNSRLKQNGYYTDSITTYGNNLKYYFNLLQNA
jgi:flagellum-specific peptidoglycan hydrolase FlgJ